MTANPTFETNIVLTNITDLGETFNMFAQVGPIIVDMDVDKTDRLDVRQGDKLKFDARWTKTGLEITSDVEFIRDNKTYAIRPVTVNYSGPEQLPRPK